MLYLPLGTHEDSIVLEWVTSKSTLQQPSRKVSTILQWMTSRLVAQGRYAEAIGVLTKALQTLKASDEAYRRAQESLKELSAAVPPMMRSLIGLSAGATQTPSSQAQSVTGQIAQVPWLPRPQLALPAPRSLLDAQSHAAAAAEADSAACDKAAA